MVRQVTEETFGRVLAFPAMAAFIIGMAAPASAQFYVRSPEVSKGELEIEKHGAAYSGEDERLRQTHEIEQKYGLRRQKESAATLHRFKTQDVDRARAAAALVVAANTRAEARALAMRLEQERRKNHRRQKSNNSN